MQFVIGSKVVHTSRAYNSGNIWRKIIAYARTRRGGAPPNLPTETEVIAQVLQGAIWVTDKNNE